ncbi:MAG: hypothetical protein IJQ83_07815 [Bacteroidales bacterium]|nr:hypothetical protein [Bacteroidales bacterium]
MEAEPIEIFYKRFNVFRTYLEDNPYMGQIEPLLANKPKEYRSIVINRLNKIIYYIKGETIRVSALWDTRREPKSLLDEVE